jgi:signal transduction histidine kinase
LEVAKKIRPLSETGASDIRQATRAFNETQRQLVDALRGQQHMLAAIGHDLRTPLTSLRVRAETLPDSREREKIITKTEEMAATLEAILEFAKAQADDHSLDFHSIDLASLLQDLCQDYQTAKKQIKLDVQENIDLMGSAANLNRALRNIIDNGLFYGTAVSLTLGLSETNAIITIDDDGPGVDADMLEKLTAPFFRIDKSRNSESGGIGMGLALAKTVIEHHQGTLQFQNIKNGFRATIALPLTVS